MTEKIIGYVLLTLGVFIIFFSAFSTYQVFTKKSQPVQLFNFEGISIDTSSMLEGSLPPEFAELMPQNGNKKSTQEIIPRELINDSSNIFAHLMLMGFVASVGAKLASLGVQMIRPIIVKLKAKEVQVSN